MKKLLIIPDIHHLQESEELAGRYGAAFEYNDFFDPYILNAPDRRGHAVVPGIIRLHSAHACK